MTYSEPEEYLLYRIGYDSRFINKTAHNNDSIRLTFLEKGGAKAFSAEYTAEFMNTQAYKIKHYSSDLRTSKRFNTKYRMLSLYETYQRHYLKEPMQLSWEMIPGVDTISGIACRKAKTDYGGRVYTAWYALNIPISDGPYIFQGLPGLITKVVDADQWYQFQINQFNINPKSHLFLSTFVTQDYPLEIDRKTYIKRSFSLKIDPKFPVWMPNVTPEKILALREKRKTRFDLIIEKQ
jgi:GLPGLI family protein